ncbi:glycosyltransferase family 4 protein [Flavobacterium restrictum]|uniref:Glycosyltransferase family 4 protein n=1 Tax=Flavobacterium restrictum TaxID=2594428 RepID=A0A553DWF3_9FLAO|nr:glycosyltransferase family 4 protein [Flavobacterium restrictum]
MSKKKLIRITTIPLSLDKLLSGQLHFMNAFYDVIAVSSDNAYLQKIGNKEKTRTFSLAMSRKITPFLDLVAVVQLFLFLKKEKPLVVHSHTPKAGIVAMLAAKLARVPIRLHTVAGLPLMETNGPKRKLLEAVEKVTYSCATRIYPNSRGLFDFLVTNEFIAENKMKVIGNGSSNGIDTAYFSPDKISETQQKYLRISLGIQNDDFVFVFVGRLVGDKGINELVLAFKNANQHNKRLKLLLVGTPEMDLDPLQAVTQLEIAHHKNIISVGFQEDIRPYLAISDALVFPSYREGFPNVVLQAGAMGLPAIVTNINGCNEIIKDGQNGIIIPVKNSDAIEKVFFKLMKDKQLFKFLQSNARPMITSRFEQKEIWKLLRAEYQELETAWLKK